MPTSVSCPNLANYYFLAYDKKGNIFVDGAATLSTTGIGLCEIKAGASSGTAITLNTSVEFPGTVQWDGTYLAVGDQDAASIDRFQIRGTTGTEKGTVLLNGSSSGGMFFLPSRDRVLSPESNGIGVFDYPAGGNALKTLPIGNSAGFTVSPTRLL